MTEFEIVQYITQHAKRHGYSNFINSIGSIPTVESLLRKLPKLAVPLSDQKSKKRSVKKDAIGQAVVPGSLVAFTRSREDRNSKGFFVGGIVTRVTESFVFAKISEDAPEVRKTLDKTVVIG